MKKTIGLIAFLAFVGLLAVMLFTCPTEADHHTHLRKTALSAIEQKMDDRFGAEVGGFLKGMVGMSFFGENEKFKIDRLVRVDNYYLFSVGHVVFKGNDHIVSVGVMNHIFAPDKEDMMKLMDEAGI